MLGAQVKHFALLYPYSLPSCAAPLSSAEDYPALNGKQEDVQSDAINHSRIDIVSDYGDAKDKEGVGLAADAAEGWGRGRRYGRRWSEGELRRQNCVPDVEIDR